jgi:hypothetical protein
VVIKVKLVTDIHFSSYCYTCFLPPLIREPPKTPLPDPKQNPAWYGELWIKYPLNQTLYSMDCGYLFKARSEFSIILNRAALKFFGDKGGKASQPPPPPPPREIVVDLVEDFGVWYSSLPDPLTPKKIVFPSQIILQ